MKSMASGWLDKHSVLLQQLETGICSYWIPFGLVVFLSGFFWAPNSHNHIILVTNCLLLPALLSAFAWRRWRAASMVSPALVLTAVFLTYMSAIAVLENGDDGTEFIKWSVYIVFFIFAVGIRMQVSEATLTYLLTFSALVAALAGCYAASKDMQSGQFWLPNYRLKGYATLYNELRSGFLFGAFALLAAWAAFDLSNPRWLRAMAFAAASLCALTTLLTGSRAPLLGLLIASVWISVANRRWLRLLLILCTTAVILFFAWDRLSERGTSLRPEIWRYVWGLCKEQPWFGHGLVRYPLEVMTSYGVRYNTHNLFLTVLYYGGAFGLLLFLAVAASTLYLSWRDRFDSRVSLLAALLQIYSLVALQFDGVNLITRPADFWVLLWLPIALHLFGRMQILRRKGNCAAL
jgi:O-antigen ligase